MVSINLGVEVQGVIDSVLVGRGQAVAKGQTVALMRSTVERANLDQALARVQMDSELNARNADLELARQVLDRRESLLAQQLIPQQEVDEARSRYRVAKAARSHARDNSTISKHELLRAEALYRQRIITSPIDGVVIRQHAKRGELVTDTPVLTLATLDVLRVEAILPADQLHRYAIGGQALVIPETDAENPVSATIMAIDPMLDAASGTFGIELSLKNAALSIVAGQQCQVRFDTAALSG